MVGIGSVCTAGTWFLTTGLVAAIVDEVVGKGNAANLKTISDLESTVRSLIDSSSMYSSAFKLYGLDAMIPGTFNIQMLIGKQILRLTDKFGIKNAVASVVGAVMSGSYIVSSKVWGYTKKAGSTVASVASHLKFW